MYNVNLGEAAAQFDNFRTVLHTTEYVQIVAMTLKPGEDIGAEVHPDNDQVLTFHSGRVRAEVAGDTAEVGPGHTVVVPAGTEHNFTNIGDAPVRLITLYGPPDHAADTVHATKADAEADEHDDPDGSA